MKRCSCHSNHMALNRQGTGFLFPFSFVSVYPIFFELEWQGSVYMQCLAAKEQGSKASQWEVNKEVLYTRDKILFTHEGKWKPVIYSEFGGSWKTSC